MKIWSTGVLECWSTEGWGDQTLLHYSITPMPINLIINFPLK